MNPEQARLLASPDAYLHAFDSEDAVFVPMDRAAYARSIFLDQRISPAAAGTMRVPAGRLEAAAIPVRPASWIFHVAHCGSTLLARALDQLGGTLVLREPLALRQLALAPDPGRLRLALGLLTRRYAQDAPTLIKANVPVNFILDDLAASGAVDRAIALYLGLEDYLTAILRSDNHRAWLRGVTGQLARHLGDLSQLSDGQLAAALWLAQMERFAAAAAALPGLRSLDAERLFADPRAAVLASAAHLGVATDAAAVAEVVDGPLFATYSKRPEVAFSEADRQARRAADAARLAPEIAAGADWLAGQGVDPAEVTAGIAGLAL